MDELIWTPTDRAFMCPRCSMVSQIYTAGEQMSLEQDDGIECEHCKHVFPGPEWLTIFYLKAKAKREKKPPDASKKHPELFD